MKKLPIKGEMPHIKCAISFNDSRKHPKNFAIRCDNTIRVHKVLKTVVSSRWKEKKVDKQIRYKLLQYVHRLCWGPQRTWNEFLHVLPETFLSGKTANEQEQLCCGYVLSPLFEAGLAQPKGCNPFQTGLIFWLFVVLSKCSTLQKC